MLREREAGMMSAYVFVWTKVGQGKNLARQIAKLPGVKLADCCWGRPDVVVFAEVADAKALDRLVIGGIAKVRGVEATETHLVVTS
jgi:DNA-binding Lrp family transcriptional regulator